MTQLTVEKLIELLQKEDPKAFVYTDDSSGYHYEVNSVTEVKHLHAVLIG